jgi:hypothetical protein
MRLIVIATAGFAAVYLSALLASAQPAELREENFSSDPLWEGYRNRLVPTPAGTTRQDFGYRTTSHARGAKPGEIGGWIQRSVTPAYYAKKISAKTLNDRLSASGKFAVTQAEGGSGMLFGWFNENSRGWRTPNSIAFRIDGSGGNYRVFFEYGTQHWLTGGMGCFEGERYQTTKTKPFPSNGTVHEWSLTYDPDGAAGKGQVTFILDGKEYVLLLADGHKEDGAVFNRFGMWNLQTSGSGLEIYFDDLVINSEAEAFNCDPKWDALGSQVEFEDRALRPLHDFGYTRTNRAGGKAGEIGGIIWRDESPSYYAAKVRPFCLDDELFASGRLAFTGAGSDSGVCIGWFDSTTKRNKTADHQERQKNLLAIMIEGPSRIGHYFRPVYSNSTGDGELKQSGPIIRPDGAAHRWLLHYRPDGAGGSGQITFKLDDHEETFNLKPGVRSAGATFNRFGIFNIQFGGHFVYVYLDDLSYTAQPAANGGQ